MKTILVIEDQPQMRRNVCTVLEMEGFEVLTAENGRLGVAAAKEDLPDLILCDVMMPVMDGHAFMARLREDEAHQHIPVVITSASPQVPEGARAHLRKPYELHRLLDVISEHKRAQAPQP